MQTEMADAESMSALGHKRTFRHVPRDVRFTSNPQLGVQHARLPRVLLSSNGRDPVVPSGPLSL
jgi:hypothetical protein